MHGQVPDTLGSSPSTPVNSDLSAADTSGRDSTTIVSNTFFDIFEGNPGSVLFIMSSTKSS